MVSKWKILQETQAAWEEAQSFDEIRAMNQTFMEQSRQQIFCATPYNLVPLTTEQCQHVETLIRLQSYGIIPLSGVNPTGIHWELIDGEYVHTRVLSDFLFLIRHGVKTERFLDKIKSDERLNKQVRDCFSDTDIGILTDSPTSIQRRALSMEQLYKQPFTCIEGACGTVKLEDCGLEEVSAVTSAGVYICRVLLKIDSDYFMTQSDSSVARTMRKLHLLQTIEDYAQQTLSEEENEYIRPPYTSRRSRILILDELDWNISEAPDTATHYGEEVDLSTRIFAGPVTLSLPNRYWDILQEDESEFTAIEYFEIRVDGGSLRDILLAIQQENERMDAAAGEKHIHGDKLYFEGLQRHDEHTWWVNTA
ncbi:hypothetical protein G3M48_009556 [Beauveria asiatica]|uniref:Uncharacterized protein n=1 Tax=Beauveria asiatica TaxID=1069075 RepID=A0AAW0S3B9_9HYPO